MFFLMFFCKWYSVLRFRISITISCRSFVFSQSRAKVSAGLTNVSGLAAFDLCIGLFVCPSVCLNILIVAVVTGPELTLVCVLKLVLLSVFRLKKSDLLGKLLSAF